VEVRIDDDGEILVRSEAVMTGYRNRPEATREVIDPDGWLHTGDLGRLDADGYLSIVGRKKEIIINAAGKNMSPANIEAALKSASPLIDQACCVGDGRPYNVALLSPDAEALAWWAGSRGLQGGNVAALVAHPAVLAEVAEAVERANAQLSRVEQIKRFRLLPVAWEPDGDELTPTMKVKRGPILEAYAREIEALYG